LPLAEAVLRSAGIVLTLPRESGTTLPLVSVLLSLPLVHASAAAAAAARSSSIPLARVYCSPAESCGGISGGHVVLLSSSLDGNVADGGRTGVGNAVDSSSPPPTSLGRFDSGICG
jgi:hypothetical protein